MKKSRTTDGKKPLVRICAWVEPEIKEEFVRMVRIKYGGMRGGTRIEVANALVMYMRRSQGVSRFRKNGLDKLMELAMELETGKGYPNIRTRLLRLIVSGVAGKDRRTIQKYVNIIQSRSDPTPEHGTINWDVSPFVEEVYRCNRESIDPKHIMMRADAV